MIWLRLLYFRTSLELTWRRMLQYVWRWSSWSLIWPRRVPHITSSDSSMLSRRSFLCFKINFKMDGWVGGWVDGWMVYIAHRRRKTSNPLNTLVLSEQECFQWTSERLVTTRRITEVSRQRVPSRWSSDSEGPTTKWAELSKEPRLLTFVSYVFLLVTDVHHHHLVVACPGERSRLCNTSAIWNVPVHGMKLTVPSLMKCLWRLFPLSDTSLCQMQVWQ